jgi:energy-coupling factor transporter ATP-binding protein EcfA2
MYISYGWPDGESNPAFRDRSLPLDPKKPCVMVGRNGSGKTLASNVLRHAREIIFGHFELYQSGLKFMKNIGLKWFEVELQIPMVSVYVDSYGSPEIRGETIAWDLVNDDGEVWLPAPMGDLFNGYEVEYHSFNCELMIKLRIEDFTGNPSYSVSHMMLSTGSLEIDKDDAEDDDDSDYHHGFSAHTSSKFVQNLNRKLSDFESVFKEVKEANFWVQLMNDSINSGMDSDNMRREYQSQLRQVSEQLNKQCIDKGFGNPDVFGDDNDGYDPGKNESNMLEIFHQKGKEIFPPIQTSSVNRIAPEIEPWKKTMLEEIVTLHSQISKKMDIGKFGIAGEMLLEVLNDFEEITPSKYAWDGIKFVVDLQFVETQSTLDNISKSIEHAEFLEKERHRELNETLKKYKEYEEWLNIIPLFVQNNPMYSSKQAASELSDTIIGLGNNHRTDDVEGKLISAIWRYNQKMEQCFDNLEHLIILIAECFPTFPVFNKAENRYTILVDSITKFQQSDKIDEMYRRGMVSGLKKSRNRIAHGIDEFSFDKLKALNQEIESKHSDLHLLFSRYMVLYWYAFEMDREVLVLYETYMRVFSPRDASSLSEFLHIIENHDVLPSGFRHILSMVLGITSSQESCIYFVDEPEISLHIEWQRKLVKHLRFLLDEFRDNSILLVATHSPDIMLNHLEDIVNFSPKLID